VSYQVFARKYRPQTFDDLVGQTHVVRTLKNAIEQKRLAHAYLFVGPRGTGKTSTARILAKALNASKARRVTPCGVCDNCKEISGGNSLDVLELDAASNRGIDDVRELRDNVRYAPAKGKYKIYIIDEVHMLTKEAANALLKTLEEPPQHVIFCLATTEPEKLPITILSRCQRFDLHRIPANLIAQHLQFIAEKEKVKLEPSAAHAIARGADGGLRDAESMLDQLVAFCGETIAESDVLNVFGFTSEQTVAEFTERNPARADGGSTRRPRRADGGGKGDDDVDVRPHHALARSACFQGQAGCARRRSGAGIAIVVRRGGGVD
jgi:DNA polymerase-3 subunit gamma/tau